MAGVGGEAPSPVAPTPSQAGGAGGPSPGSAAVASKPNPGVAGTPNRTPLAVEPSEVASARRWIARVWPAIALGGEAGPSSIVSAVETALLRPALATIRRSLRAVAGVARAVGYGGVADLGTPPKSSPRHGFLSSVASAAEWKKIGFFAAMAAILALLAFTVWREFRAAMPPYAR
ncbi:MAG TPA: hypothetical protein VF729_00965 [Solirubrobacterales bacterium]